MLCLGMTAAGISHAAEDRWNSLCEDQTCKAFPHVEAGSGFNALAYEVGDTPVLEVVTPLGINLQKGIVLIVDETESFKTKLLSCDLDGCRSYLELRGGLLTALRLGLKLDITVQTSKSREVVSFPVSLLGFSDAVAKVTE